MTRAVGILGLGCYIPEKILTNADMEKLVDTSDEWITDRTGIKQRHIAAESEATTDLAYNAAVEALRDAGVTPDEIDLVILATASPDHIFPSSACLVQDRLGAKNAAAFDLAAGCSGFVYSLAVASQMIKGGLYNKILIIGAETLSRITNWEDRNTCVLFGDGAGAAVVGIVEDGYGVLGIDMGADGSGGQFLMQPAGGSRRPASSETVAAKEHTIHMSGQDVFKFAIQIMGKTAKRALNNAGMKPEELDMLFPHQANLRIISSAAKRLKMPMEKVWVNVDKYANTSAASIPIALCEAQKAGALHKGDNIMLDGFGAGLTWAAVVLKWSK
ncbi:MAG: beta-ketoacyl-ACP synthase III [Acidaminococcaceae bacterium]|nr:beta-ketoacyl-ACP synthase III [Acidaminococcaceae bacterium]